MAKKKREPDGAKWWDTSWNPLVGCTHASPGCDNCWAKGLHDMRHAAYLAGKQMPQQYAKPFGQIQLLEDRLAQPMGWRKPRRVFVNSMSDLFHEGVPTEFIARVFDVIRRAPQHRFYVLTRRAKEMYSRTPPGTEPPNVWLGVSVESQECEGNSTLHYWYGDVKGLPKNPKDRVRWLVSIPDVRRFISFEPLLGPMGDINLDGIDWVIVGCESGPKRRPCELGWVESIVDQCRKAGVPPFVKQIDLDGKVCRNFADFPESVQAREYAG